MSRWIGCAVLFLCLAVLVGLVPQQGFGGDWPQILGPTRNGTASEDETLADSWPDDGPPLAWEAPVGRGFAGAAVSGGQTVVFHRTGDREFVETRDAITGTVTWSKQYSTDFEPQYGRDDGPMCVPTIAGERIVTLGAGGILTCWNLADGEVIWRIDTQRDFKVLQGYFGVGSSPLVHDGMVIVNVGARDDEAGLVAFSIDTGEVVWSAVSDGASYSSPVIADISGEAVVVALTRFKCVGVSAEDGSLKFEFRYGLRGANVTAANPVVIGDSLFLSASYGVGAVYGDLGAEGFESVWSNDEIMSSQYTTCIEHDGLLFGVDGRQDIPPAVLRCFDPRTGDVRWSVDNFGYATLLKADDKLLISKTDGELVLAELSAEGFQPLARAQLFNDTVRALPALANGRLYIRDSERLKCFDLRPPTARQGAANP